MTNKNGPKRTLTNSLSSLRNTTIALTLIAIGAACGAMALTVYAFDHEKRSDEVATETLAQIEISEPAVTTTYAISVSPEELVQNLKNADLPVADIQYAITPESKGTVIYIPQYHRYPGSELNDSRNDVPEQVQHEMHEIVDAITDIVPVTMAFTEGRHFGAVNEADRATLAEQTKHMSEFERQAHDVPRTLEQNGQTDLVNPTTDDATRVLTHARRSIALSGAIEREWAVNDKLRLFGTENPATREQSRDLIVELVYLQDRMRQVARTPNTRGLAQPALARSATVNTGANGSNQSLREALIRALMARSSGTGAEIGNTAQQNAPRRDVKNDLRATAELLSANGQSEKGNAMNAFLDSRSVLAAFDGLRGDPIKSAGPAQSRDNNPFASVTNANELQRHLDANKKKIESIVVHQRNIETAEEVARVMTEENESLAVLQYGAGHAEGLIEALQKEGLSVITITPHTVGLQK